MKAKSENREVETSERIVCERVKKRMRERDSWEKDSSEGFAQLAFNTDPEISPLPSPANMNTYINKKYFIL